MVSENIGVGLLLLLLLALALASAHNKCPECPAGKFQKSCDNGRANCQACPDNTFSERPNTAFKCQDCLYSCPQGQHMIQGCSSIANMLCECKKGTYWKSFGGTEGICKRHRKCSKYEVFIEEGTATQDRRCIPGKPDMPDEQESIPIPSKEQGGGSIIPKSNLVILLIVAAVGFGLYQYLRRRPRHERNE